MTSRLLTLLGLLSLLLPACSSGAQDRADRLYRAGEYGKAAEAYQRAIDREPGNKRLWRLYEVSRRKASDKHNRLGQIALDRGDLEVAAVEFEKAARYYPSNDRARRNRDRAMALLDRSRRAYAKGRRAYAAGKWGEAVEQLEVVLPYPVTYPDAANLHAEAREKTGNKEVRVRPRTVGEVREEGLAAAERERLHDRAAEVLAAGDAAAAHEIYEEILRRDPADEKARRKLEELRSGAAGEHWVRAATSLREGDWAAAYREARFARKLSGGETTEGADVLSKLQEQALSRAEKAAGNGRHGLAHLHYRQALKLGIPERRVGPKLRRELDAVLARVNPGITVGLFEEDRSFPFALSSPMRRVVRERIRDRSFLREAERGTLLLQGRILEVTRAEDRKSVENGQEELSRLRVQLDQAEARYLEARRDHQRALDQVTYWQDQRRTAGPGARRLYARRLERARRMVRYRRRELGDARTEYQRIESAYRDYRKRLLTDGEAPSRALEQATRKVTVRIEFSLVSLENQRTIASEEVVGRAESWIDRRDAADEEDLVAEAVRDAGAAVVRKTERILWNRGRPWRERALEREGLDAVDAAITYLLWLDLTRGGRDEKLLEMVEEATGERL